MFCNRSVLENPLAWRVMETWSGSKVGTPLITHQLLASLFNYQTVGDLWLLSMNTTMLFPSGSQSKQASKPTWNNVPSSALQLTKYSPCESSRMSTGVPESSELVESDELDNLRRCTG